MVRSLVAFVSGAVFAIGLGVGEMTRPARVVAFLDVAGRWDPRLAFVMAAAVATAAILFPRIVRRSAAWSGGAIALPSRTDVDVPLVVGAGIFGIGWGLAGYCPGPALVALATGAPSVVVFVAAMALGLCVGGTLLRTWSARGAERVATPPTVVPVQPL